MNKKDFLKFDYIPFKQWWTLKKKQLKARGYMDDFDIRQYKKYSANLEYLSDKLEAFNKQ